MTLHRDGAGAVWVMYDDGHEVRLEDLAPDDRTDLLDDLVHDAKGDEAAAINNAGEAAQLAYLLADPRTQGSC